MVHWRLEWFSEGNTRPSYGPEPGSSGFGANPTDRFAAVCGAGVDEASRHARAAMEKAGPLIDTHKSKQRIN